MASLSLTASYTGHSRPSSNTAWTNTTGSSEWYVGNSGGTVYCGRVEFVTPANVGSGTALSITAVCNQTSNPGYTRGYLCSNSLTSTQCQSISTLQGQTGYMGIMKNTLNSGNQSAGTSVTYTYDGSLSLSPNTTYYIYFLRNGTSYNGFCVFRANPTLSLTYTVRQCTLAIAGDSGVASVTGSGSYTYGTNATTVATAKTGYHLTYYSGTQANGAGGGSWDGCSGLTSHTDNWTMNANRTIQVHSALDTYTVSYNANGGTGAPAAQTKTYGVNLTLSSTKPTRSGTSSTFTITGNGNGGVSKSVTATKTTSYTFAGWAASPGGSVAYAAGGSYTANAAVTLYAVWTSSVSYSSNTIAALGSTARQSASAGSYSVAFDANGGDSTPPTRYAARTTSYTFLGWGDSAGNALANTTAYTSDATVYARWSGTTTTAPVTLPAAITRKDGTAAGYTVSFDGNGGTPGVGSLSAINTIRYTFASWQGYAAGSSYTPTGNVTLVAWYDPKTILGAVTLPGADRIGYSLLGWAADPAAENGMTGSYTPSGDVTLYAVWEPRGLIHIYDGGAWRDGLVWVFDGTAWRRGLPWCYDGTIWRAGG